MKYANRIIFSFLLIVLFLLSVYSDSGFFFVGFDKPWQLQPIVHEDSLCSVYKEKYKQLGKSRVISTEVDSSRSTVVILIDAWGVPLNSVWLENDFGLFEEESTLFAVHTRLANRNTHAEGVEFRNNYDNSTYFFGGDSLEYGRDTSISRLGFEKVVFCQNCGDEVMLVKLDSAIADTSISQPRMLAWTTQTSRDGNRENLHKTLAGIAKLAQKYPEMQFVIQGTHRPILGTPETRRMYHAHWVPVVVIHATK